MKRKPKVKQPPKQVFHLWNERVGSFILDRSQRPLTAAEKRDGWRRIKYSLTSRVTPGGRE